MIEGPINPVEGASSTSTQSKHKKYESDMFAMKKISLQVTGVGKIVFSEPQVIDGKLHVHVSQEVITTSGAKTLTCHFFRSLNSDQKGKDLSHPTHFTLI